MADTAVEAFALEAVGVAELDEGLGIEGVAGAKAVAGEEVGDGVVFRGEGVKKVYGAVGEGEVVVTGAECPLQGDNSVYGKGTYRGAAQMFGHPGGRGREVVVGCPVACERGGEEFDGAFKVGDFKYARHHAESSVEHGGKQRYAAVRQTGGTHALFPEHGAGRPEAEFGRKEGIICPEPLHIAVGSRRSFVK